MSLDLNVKVDATTAPYEAAIGRATQSTLRYDAALGSLESDLMKLQKQLDDDVAAALDRQHHAMTKVGQGAFVFGAAVAAGLGMAANEAMKWESAWTGVTKTVDGSAGEMERLEGGLRQLALSLPATHEEIAAVAEAAGQLGIKRESIIGFTKTMIDLSETTNLTADQAATDMARFANIMQTPQGEIDRLGASLVALGNDGASTEADILSMAMRIAGAGATIGLTEGEVMGLANALSSVGIEAEAGGSAISAVMKTIELKSTQGAEAVSGFAEVAGMSSQAFLDLWGADSAAGLDAFVTGLGKVESQGGNTVATLQELGFTQIRQSDALLRLANSGDLLTESLKLGNEAWDENTALLAEAENRYATTEARVQIAQNTLRDAAIDVGAVLLPALAKVADLVADLGAAWDQLPGPVKTAGVVLGIAAAAIGLFGGAALIAIPKIVAFNVAVKGLEAGALKTAGTRVSALGSALMGPLGIGLAGATVAVGIFAAEQGAARRRVDDLVASLDAQTGAITELTRATVIKRLEDEGALQAARELGISTRDVADAAMENEAALARVQARLREVAPDALDAGKGWISFDLALSSSDRNAHKVGESLQNLAEDTDKARAVVDRTTEALGANAGASEKAGEEQKTTNVIWDDGADAARDLGDEAKTLGEQLQGLSEAYLNQRDAGRAVRSSLREIRDGLREYRKEHEGLGGAFKSGTASGDEFAGMLDGLATDYQNQIDAAEKSGASEKRLQGIYAESRAELIRVADRMGMTREEARAYADQVLSTPGLVKTYFDALTEGAELDVRRFRGLLDGLDGDTVQTFIRVTTTKNSIDETSAGQPPNRSPEANGGIRQTFSGGGFTFGGQYVDRVPQLRQGGGSVVWNEPETGWEGYISGKPGMEARNREVWLDSGRRLGMIDSRYDNVGARSFGSSGGGGGAPAGVAWPSGPVEVRGTLNTPWGPAEIRGMIDDRIDANRSYERATGRRGR